MSTETSGRRRWGWRLAILTGIALFILAGTVSVVWPKPFYHVQSVQVVAPGEAVPGQTVRLDIYVTDRANGKPVEGADVWLSVLSAQIAREQKKTSEHGQCSFEFAGGAFARGLLLYVIEVKSDLGEDALLGRIRAADASPGVQPPGAAPIFIVTDKPIYQPGQTIHYSAFVLEPAGLTPRKATDAQVEIRDSRNNLLAQRALRTSEHGNVNGSLDLAQDILTGDYRIAVASGRDRAEKTVTVKRYVRKRIEAGVTFSPPYACPECDVSAAVRAAYFSGPPAKGAKLSLTLSRPDTESGAQALPALTRTYAAETDPDGQATLALGRFDDWLRGKEDWAALRAELQVDDGGTPEKWEGTLNLYRRDRIVELLPEGGTLLPRMSNRLLLAAYRPDGAPAPGEYEVGAGGSAQKVRVGSSGIAALSLTPRGDQLDARVSWKDDSGKREEAAISFAWLERNGMRFSMPCEPLRPGGPLTLSCAVRDDLLKSLRELRVTLATPEGIIAQRFLPSAAEASKPLTFKLPERLSSPFYLIGYLKTDQGAYHAALTLPLQGAPTPSLELRPEKSSLLPGEENRLTVKLTGFGAAALVVTDKSILARAGGATPESELSDWLVRQSAAMNLPPPAIAGLLQGLAAFMPFRSAAGATDVATNGAELALRDAQRAQLWQHSLIAAVLALIAGFVVWQIGAFLHRHARLLEVVVAIFVILILAGMLLPALARAREEARKSSSPPMSPEDVERAVAGASRGGVSERAAISIPPLAGRVREYFPETLLFLPEVVLTNGEAQVAVRLADNVTTWHAGAVAVADSGGLAGAGADFTATKPFFIEPDFPVAFIEGDEPVLRVTALSSGAAGRATVTLEPAEFYTTAESTRSALLDANGRAAFEFPIKLARSGSFRLNVRAACGDQSDRAALPVEVTPNGREVADSFSVLLAGGETASRKLQLPPEAVLRRYTLRVSGAPLADFLSGLEGMLQSPYGCFEQTTSINYPNLMVLEYLKKTGRVAPQVEESARRYLAEGYQRLLTFEVRSTGGFSLYGREPASPWLSAYGLMELQDMKAVMYVDPAVLERTWQYLRKQGPGQDNATRSYAVWAASKAGIGEAEVKDWAGSVRGVALGDSDPYIRALALNATLAVWPDDRELRDAAPRLAEFLLGDRPATPGYRTLSSACGRGAEVETLALATLALEKANASVDLRSRLLKRIVEYRARNGAWPGTQATVLALQALSSCAVYGPASGEVVVRSGGIQLGRLSLDGKGEAPVSLEFSAPPEDTVALQYNPSRAAGSGDVPGAVSCVAVAQGQLRWTQEEKDTGRSGLNLTVETAGREFACGQEIPLTAFVQERGDGVENALVEIGVSPAVTANEQSLAELCSTGKIQKYELSAGRVVLYLGKLGRGEKVALPMKLLAVHAGSFLLPPSRAYEYYRPENLSVAAGGRLVIR